MTVSIDLEETEHITLTNTDIEARPPDAIAFTVDGRITVADALLAEFEGATLNPVRVTVSRPDAESISIDLTGSATLRLENVDVGVATPDEDDIAGEIANLRPSTDDESDSGDGEDGGDDLGAPEVIAFTVEGTVRDVPTATLEEVGGADQGVTLESIVFAVDGTRLSDGGTDDDVLFELSLLGYGIVVCRDGTIVVGSDRDLASIDLA